jgi:hypothetical protein
MRYASLSSAIRSLTPEQRPLAQGLFHPRVERIGCGMVVDSARMIARVCQILGMLTQCLGNARNVSYRIAFAFLICSLQQAAHRVHKRV